MQLNKFFWYIPIYYICFLKNWHKILICHTRWWRFGDGSSWDSSGSRVFLFLLPNFLPLFFRYHSWASSSSLSDTTTTITITITTTTNNNNNTTTTINTTTTATTATTANSLDMNLQSWLKAKNSIFRNWPISNKLIKVLFWTVGKPKISPIVELKHVKKVMLKLKMCNRKSPTLILTTPPH